MKNQQSFLGYSRLGNEITAHKADWREQIDLSTPHPIPKDTDPLYHHLLAPNQWPRDQLLPEFRPSYERCVKKMLRDSPAMARTMALAMSPGRPI